MKMEQSLSDAYLYVMAGVRPDLQAYKYPINRSEQVLDFRSTTNSSEPRYYMYVWHTAIRLRSLRTWKVSSSRDLSSLPWRQYDVMLHRDASYSHGIVVMGVCRSDQPKLITT